MFGSGASGRAIPQGKQANQLALRQMGNDLNPGAAYLPAARMRNYDWENHIGSIDKGKFADIIAVVH